MDRRKIVQFLALLLCISLLLFLGLTYQERTKGDSESVVLETDSSNPILLDSDHGDLLNENMFNLPVSNLFVSKDSLSSDGVLVSRRGANYMPLSIPVSHRSLGLKERMLERAEFLERAVDTLEKGPAAPSWPWEILQENKREDPLLQRDAAAIQSSTSQQVAALLKKNLAEADAELRARRIAASKVRSNNDDVPLSQDMIPQSATSPKQIQVSHQMNHLILH